MTKTYRRRDPDDDDDDILQDGEVLHVPLYLMDGRPNPDLDSLQRDVGRHYASADGAGNSGLSLHKPGFRVSSTITRDRSIYDAYDAAAEVAYKNLGAVESEVRGQRERDSCAVKSDQGRDGSTDSKLSDAMRDERENVGQVPRMRRATGPSNHQEA
jgi:hypothetical protein